VLVLLRGCFINYNLGKNPTEITLKWGFFQYFIQPCVFICLPMESTVSEDACWDRTQDRDYAIGQHCLSDALTTRPDLILTLLDLIHNRLDLTHTRLDLIHTQLGLIHTRLDLNHLIHHTVKIFNQYLNLVCRRFTLFVFRRKCKVNALEVPSKCKYIAHYFVTFS
jgi:hypothetical protein